MDTNDFGLKLKELLGARSLSIRKCSELTGIDKATISRIINGKRKANLQHLEKFAAGLDVPIMELVSAAGYPPVSKKKRNFSDVDTSIKEIQQILESSDSYDGPFSMEAIHKQMTDYEQFAQTEAGKQTIHRDFDEKLIKVGSIGPFINQLKNLYQQFVHHKGTPYELTIIGGVLLYFIMPVDVIPDYIFPIGYVDDAIAVQIALKSLSK